MPAQQIYDDYWNFTLAYTDFNGLNFIGALRAVVTYIDRTSDTPYSPDKYDHLQAELENILKINRASVRKVINQLVKMGFVNVGLRSYHPDAIPYIHARSNEQRKIILSRIVYANASFERSVTTESDQREINFIIKTLEANQKLSKQQLAALMRMSTGTGNSSASMADIDAMLLNPAFVEFTKRKYNQIDHLWNLLRKLDGIVAKPAGFISIHHDESEQISDDEPSAGTKGRDKYLQAIYKRQLKEEVKSTVGQLVCMVEGIDFPPMIYIASHIKPYKRCNTQEAYDPNNGLLLSLNIDKLFDAGLISFEDDGKIIISKRLHMFSKNLYDHLSTKTLNPVFINQQRKTYLAYHRSRVFN